MANTTLQIRHSTVAGNTPFSLANGEIAINSRDGVLYYSTPSGTVTALSASSGPAGLNKEIQFNDSGSLGGNNKLTFDKTTGELVVNGTVRANIFSDDGIDLLSYTNKAFAAANAAHLTANSAFANNVIQSLVYEVQADGSTSTFDIGYNPISQEAVMVTIAGIVQPISTYTVNTSANTVTFTENPANNELVRVASFYSGASPTYLQLIPANVTPSIFETTANGSVSTFALGFNPGDSASVLVSIGGVIQPLDAYSVNTTSNTISFIGDTPVNGEKIRVVSFYSAANVFIVNNNSITFEKLETTVNTKLSLSLNQANAAFVHANSAYSNANGAFAKSNAAYIQANSAFIQSNSAFYHANAAFESSNSAYAIDETQNTTIQIAYNHANAAFEVANAGGAAVADTYSRNHSNSSFHHANSAFDKANSAFILGSALDGINNTQNNSIAAAFTAANSAANSTIDIYSRNTANAAFTKANNALANTSGAIFGGELNLTGTLRIATQGGDEGGEIFLDKPATNTSLNGGVTIDIYQNKLRFFENGGATRGAFIEFTSAGSGVGTNILAGSSTDTYARNHANAAFITANAGGAVTDAYARNHANAAFVFANLTSGIDTTQNTNITYSWDTANAAFLAANNASDPWVRNQANAAFDHANAAFATANAGGGGGTTDVFARNQSNAAFDKANTGTSPVRTTVSATTASLASNATGNLTVTMAKGYGLYKIAVSTGAWVTVYGNIARRNADFTRSITTDPGPGAGVIAEAITTGTTANVTNFTPSVIGYNDDVSVTTNAYIKVYNNSGVTNTVTVTVTYLPLEV